MIEKQTVANFREFEDVVHTVEPIHRAAIELPLQMAPELLYRGHANATWKLETTLERFYPGAITQFDYYDRAFAVKAEIETFTGNAWSIPDPGQYLGWLQQTHHSAVFDSQAYPQTYPYFGYLRHFGFPSPLLDWTASPYIAAFFAMNNVAENVDCVSVYIYSWTGKVSMSNAPGLHRRGPYVKSHKRHFIQQSHYTLCTETKNNAHYYSSHQQVAEREGSTQDRFWKVNIPVREKFDFLRRLKSMNITSFSLFGSEESLIDTMITKELVLRRPFRQNP
jgi:FRG domain